MTKESEQHQQLLQRIAVLKQEHRDLDIAITDLDSRVHANQLEMKRLKTQKLRLKDSIARLESSLIPDLHA
jgi:hypothetical protein